MGALTDAEVAAGITHIWDDKDHRAKPAELRKLCSEQVTAVLMGPPRPVSVSPGHQETVNRLGRLLARGRAIVEWERPDRDESPEIVAVQIEDPFRAIQQLRTLVRALATVHGRRDVTAHEVELARRVVPSSMPSRRSQILTLLPAHPDGLTVREAAEVLKKSNTSVRESLDELERLGLVIKVTLPPAGGRGPIGYTAVPEFADLLTPAKPLDHLGDLSQDFSRVISPTLPRKKKKSARGGGNLPKKSVLTGGSRTWRSAASNSPALKGHGSPSRRQQPRAKQGC